MGKMRDMKTGIPDIDKLHQVTMILLEDSFAPTVEHMRVAWRLEVKERIDRAFGVEIPWEMVTGYLDLIWGSEAERQMFKHLCESDVYKPYMTPERFEEFLSVKKKQETDHA